MRGEMKERTGSGRRKQRWTGKDGDKGVEMEVNGMEGEGNGGEIGRRKKNGYWRGGRENNTEGHLVCFWLCSLVVLRQAR